MDGRSRWADNIMIERWFRTLKTEKIYINEYTSPKRLRKDIDDFIREYNEVRPHEAIAYMTPSQRYSECFKDVA
ncbi:MAG: integrase core domain-containing protein [Oscillospiraceae bacterium]|nr:integrase core domain-containing protein [Oscillospiraceae bacterium]